MNMCPLPCWSFEGWFETLHLTSSKTIYHISTWWLYLVFIHITQAPSACGHHYLERIHMTIIHV